MPYNNQIPQPNDQLDNSQVDFLANFDTLQTMFSVDHVPLSTMAVPQVDQGKHNQLTMPSPSMAPPPLANEDVLKPVLAVFTNRTEAVYQTPATPAGTFYSLTLRQTPLQRFPGWATIAGSNLLMKWGQCTGAGFNIFAFPDDNGVSIPRFTNAPYIVMLSPISQPAQNGDVWIAAAGKSNLTFSCYASARTTVGNNPQVTFFYLAIGN